MIKSKKKAAEEGQTKSKPKGAGNVFEQERGNAAAIAFEDDNVESEVLAPNESVLDALGAEEDQEAPSLDWQEDIDEDKDEDSDE